MGQKPQRTEDQANFKKREEPTSLWVWVKRNPVMFLFATAAMYSLGLIVLSRWYDHAFYTDASSSLVFYLLKDVPGGATDFGAYYPYTHVGLFVFAAVSAVIIGKLADYSLRKEEEAGK